MSRTAKFIAASILAAGVGMAWSAGAHPHDENGKTRVERVIVMSDRKGCDGARRVHTMRLDGDKASVECDGERSEVSEATGADGKNERTRIIICDTGAGDPAKRAERLEKVLVRIAGNDELSAEHKERVTAALRAEIGLTRSAD